MAAAIKRWANAKVAQRHGVDKGDASKLNAAVKAAKAQGLEGAELQESLERAIGRRLNTNEKWLSEDSAKHHEYVPKVGSGGPKAKDKPDPSKIDQKKREHGEQIRSKAIGELREISRSFEAYFDHNRGGQGGTGEIARELEKKYNDGKAKLPSIADDFEVAADVFEEAGVIVTAGTLRHVAAKLRERYPHLEYVLSMLS